MHLGAARHAAYYATWHAVRTCRALALLADQPHAAVRHVPCRGAALLAAGLAAFLQPQAAGEGGGGGGGGASDAALAALQAAVRAELIASCKYTVTLCRIIMPHNPTVAGGPRLPFTRQGDCVPQVALAGCRGMPRLPRACGVLLFDLPCREGLAAGWHAKVP